MYKVGVTPKDDKYYVRLNTVVDKWIGVDRKTNAGGCRQYFYPESGVMAQMPDKGFIYSDICRWMTEEINQHAMSKYLWGGNPH